MGFALDGDSDQLERELILKQLLYLRQDINEIKQILTLIPNPED